jgi:hypothetical protein
MLNTILTALNKAESFVATSISKIKDVSKPVRKFFTWLFGQWLMLPVRYNFLNLSRYGGYSEKTIHRQFKRKLPFAGFFHVLFEPLRKKECIAAFDPSFIGKSGTKTYGLDKFWNSTEHRTMKGLEVSCLAIIDIKDRTAYCLQAEQTPAKAKNLVKHYVGVIKRHINDILPYTHYMAVDGYFWKKSFVGAMLHLGLQVISKGRMDAKLFYLHEGPQPKRGRSRKYDGPVDWQHIDRKRWKQCYCDKEIIAWELVVWSPILKQEVKAVYVQEKRSGDYAVLLSTDKDLAGEKILQYYHLRYQIEFLIRDAKTYMGLEHCQSRQKVKLYNHFNMSLYSVSAVKFLMWAQQAGEKPPFSMRSLKTYFTNKFLTQTIFDKLALDLKNPKMKNLFEECLNIGVMAA